MCGYNFHVYLLFIIFVAGSFLYYLVMLEHGFKGRHEGSGTKTFSHKKKMCFNISHIRIYSKFFFCNFFSIYFSAAIRFSNIFRNHLFHLLMPTLLYIYAYLLQFAWFIYLYWLLKFLYFSFNFVGLREGIRWSYL